MPGSRALVCEPHLGFGEALAAFLSAEDGFADCLVATTADEALREVRKGVDLVIVDLQLGGPTDGLEVLEALRHAGDSAPVLLMSEQDDVELIAAGLEAGASGYVSKAADLEEFVQACRAVLRSDVVLPARLAEPVVRLLAAQQALRAQREELKARLTARERDILRLLSRGHSRQTIALRLGISPNTVRTHLQRALGKLGVHSQLAAAAMARALFDD